MEALTYRELRVTVEGDRLTLSGATTTLEYRRATPADPGPLDPAQVAEALVGSWELEDAVVDGTPLVLPPDERSTLTFEAGGQVGAGTYCNGFGGRYEVTGDGLRIYDTAHTLIGCEGPIGDLENALVGVLTGPDLRVAVEGDRLTLSNPTSVLTYRRLPSVPVDLLTGRRWLLERVIGDGGTTPATAPAVLEFSVDGRVTLSTGCRELQTDWRASGDTVSLTYWWVTATDCPASVAPQDEALGRVLGRGFQVQVDGAVLTITTADVRGGPAPTLVYRAEGG